MADPVIVIRDCGAAGLNGLYYDRGFYNNRPYYRQKLPNEQTPLFWRNDEDRWILWPDLEPGNAWYRGSQANETRYILPAMNWVIVAGTPPAPTVTLWVPDPPPLRPSATDLRTEGEIDPVRIQDATPTFSWTFQPANGGPPQDAYHIHVATSKALLAAHTPDIWDSGIVLSSEHQATPLDEMLIDWEMYFWAVRVRDEDQIWSEDW